MDECVILVANKRTVYLLAEFASLAAYYNTRWYSNGGIGLSVEQRAASRIWVGDLWRTLNVPCEIETILQDAVTQLTRIADSLENIGGTQGSPNGVVNALEGLTAYVDQLETILNNQATVFGGAVVIPEP